jgi:hypothetical protein
MYHVMPIYHGYELSKPRESDVKVASSYVDKLTPRWDLCVSEIGCQFILIHETLKGPVWLRFRHCVGLCLISTPFVFPLNPNIDVSLSPQSFCHLVPNPIRYSCYYACSRGV